MIRANPTKNGTGIEIWGDYFELLSLYLTIHKVAPHGWTGDANGGRTKILYGLAHQVRKAYEGSRQCRKGAKGGDPDLDQKGFRFTWIDLLFALAAMRFNAGYVPTDEADQSNMFQLEKVTQEALLKFDPKGANDIIPLIGKGIDVSHDLVWEINNEVLFYYLDMNPNKRRFRDIPNLLRSSCKSYPLHGFMVERIKSAAKSLGCGVHEIEYMEYPKIKW